MIAALLWIWAAWLSRRVLPAQNVALIFGVLSVCEWALESFWNGKVLPWNGLLFWPATIVLARVVCRWFLRHRRQNWNYGVWLIVLAGAVVALVQFVIDLAGVLPWTFAIKLSAIRFAATAFCLFFLTPWFISKLPQQPQDHAQ